MKFGSKWRLLSRWWQSNRCPRPKRKAKGLRRLWQVAKPIILFFFIATIVVTASLRWLNPSTTAFILQYELSSSGQIQQQWIAIDKMSPNIPIAIVAAEDQKFPDHYGFDFESLNKALNEKRKRRRGASTITQQLAKNLFLWSGRSYVRKGLEAYFALLIELTWPKRRILEVYLNVVEFGPGIYGVQKASQHFFAKSAGQLNSREAALLAAVLPNPSRMSPGKPSLYVRQRSREIQDAVTSLGGAAYLNPLFE